MIPIDIIIVNYKSTEYLVKCIASVYRYMDNENINIYIEDNSLDNSIAKIEQRYKKVRIQRNSKNLGFGAAINHALRKCKSPYVVLLNPDTVLADGSLYQAVQYMSVNDRIGVMGPRIYEQNGSVQGSARRFPTPWTSIFGRKSPLTKLFPNNPITKKEFLCFDCNKKKIIDVDWVSGACMIIRRQAIERIGGFDEGFFLYWEDTDLCKRIKDLGWRVVYYPKARIIHSVGKSSETRAIRSIFHFHWSCFRFFAKHSRVHVSWMMPFAFSGLAARCLFVIVLHATNKAFLKSFGRKSIHKKKASFENNKRTKIIRIISRLNIGGPSIHVSLLTKKMDPARYQTILLTGTKSPSEGDMTYLMEKCTSRVEVVNELQREISFGRDLISLIKIFIIIAREKPNIVHTHMSKAGTVGRIAAMVWRAIGNRNLKIVHTFHGHVLDGYFGPLKSKLFKLIEIAMAGITDKIIAISKSQQWELTRKYKIADSKKVKVINLGFDLSNFLEISQYHGVFRKSMGIRDDTLLIGIVGRLVPIKNHQMFLKGAKMFLDRNPDIDARLIIVGDGELRGTLEAYADRLKIRSRVHFLGWKKELQYIYADLDILALTSLNEGTPVSIIEAMAASVLVITTGVGGVKDLLGRYSKMNSKVGHFKECERGILCPRNDYCAFADGLQHIADNRLFKDTTMIKSAKNYVLKNYSEARLVQKMDKLYKQMIESNSGDGEFIKPLTH